MFPRDEFRWNEWNVEHIGTHGVGVADAEYVVLHSKRPYPEFIGDGRWLVRGQTADGRYIQVIYVVDPDGETLYVIHSRPLNDREKLTLRRRMR